MVNLTAKYLASAIALTPWSLAFAVKNGEKIPPGFEIKQRIIGYQHAVENLEARQLKQHFRLVAPSQTAVKGKTGEEVDIFYWFNNLLSDFLVNKSQQPLNQEPWVVIFNLPDPYEAYTLNLSLPSNTLFQKDDSVKFELSRFTQVVCQAVGKIIRK